MLLVDDEPDIIELLQYNFKKEGYEIFSAGNGVEALEIAKKELPDIIILDVMMPIMDGFEFLGEMRKMPDVMMPIMDGVVTCRNIRSTPELKDKIVILLTARGEEYSEVAGLENGADDYITKPVKLEVLKARIKALVKRVRKVSDNEEVKIGNLKISFSERVVYKEGSPIHLPKKEFKLLALLVSKPDKLFTRQEIFNHVWGAEQVIGGRTIDVHIRKIREKLGGNYIKTIRSVGYKLETKNF